MQICEVLLPVMNKKSEINHKQPETGKIILHMWEQVPFLNTT